jgi:hypothetical protein
MRRPSLHARARFTLLGVALLLALLGLGAAAASAVAKPVARYNLSVGLDDLIGTRDAELAESELPVLWEDSELRLDEEFTIVVWYSPSGAQHWQPLIERRPAEGERFAIYAEGPAPGVPMVLGSLFLEPTAYIPEAAWMQLALTSDGETAKLYADGSLVASEPAGFQGGGNEGEILFATDWLEDELLGTIGEVAFYSQAMSAAEVESAQVMAAVVTGTTPEKTGNNNSPKVKGFTSPGSTVGIYTNNKCSGEPAATGTAAAFNGEGISVSVADNTTTTFYAKATLSSKTLGCSTTSATYVEDSIAPAKPTLSSTNPKSPANNNSPKVLGSAESGSTVKLYTNATCTGSPAVTGSAAAFASPGLTVSVADNSTTTYYATATDAAANTSACSTSSITYEESSPKVYWGAWIGGNVAEKEVGGEWWDAPWNIVQSNDTWGRFEGHAGKALSLLHFSQPPPWVSKVEHPEYLFDKYWFKKVKERGAYPLVDMWTEGATLEEIKKGVHDSEYKQWAKEAAEYGSPFFLRFDWEMNDGNGQFEYAHEAVKNATLFKEMWIHVYEIFKEQKATNVTWVWCPNISQGGSTEISKLYPGSSYVDWTCMDGYNFGLNEAQPLGWASFTEVFEPTYKELQSLASTKPIMIGEMASSEAGGSKKEWIKDAFETQLPTNFPKIRAVAWYDKYEAGGKKDWPIETSESAKSAFAGAIASRYYAGNTFTNPTELAKIEPLP